jgi:hypothetical protein
LFFAAGSDPALVDLWDEVRSVIGGTSKSVKQRPAGLDPIGIIPAITLAECSHCDLYESIEILCALIGN